MKVLYVNHTATMSGAEQSLLVLLSALEPPVVPVVACPPGELEKAIRAQGIAIRPIRGTALSARLHPLHTPRELARVAVAAWQIRRIARGEGFALVHANGARSGLMCLLAAGRRGPRLVVHIRDRMPPGRLPRLMSRLLARRAAALIPITRYLADELLALLPRRKRPLIEVIPNAVDCDRFNPDRVDPASSRRSLGLPSGDLVIGLVGQFSPHKGQREAIEILDRLRPEHPEARLVLVGSVRFASGATRFDNGAYEQELHRLVAERGLGETVHFLGERSDIPPLMGAFDVLLVPSWYEPFGRVAVEAMAMRVPVLATNEGGTTEVVRDGIDGVLLAPRQTGAWACALSQLLCNPSRRREMGLHGRERVLERFGTVAHGRHTAALYQRLLAAREAA